MIIALWGASATAKTTIARCVHARLGVPQRNCGDEIRAVARESGLSLSEVPEGLHHRVDEATRDWSRCHASEGAVLEGRFLDQVLAGEPEVISVLATCDTAIRVERWVARTDSSFCEASLAELDKADDLFRRWMYQSAEKGAAHITLDTSSGGVKQWTEKLLGLINGNATTGRG